MTEEEDKDEARHKEVLERLERNREKSSQEHGSIINVVNEQNRETRAHIASEVATVSGAIGHIKNYTARLLKAMKRFMDRHGMGSDDL